MILEQAARDGDLAEVKRLLAAGADPRARDSEALRSAAANGHVDVVRILKAATVTPETAGKLIRQAMSNRDLDTVRLLLPKTPPATVAKLLANVLRSDMRARDTFVTALAKALDPETILQVALAEQGYGTQDLLDSALTAGATGAGLPPKLAARLAPLLAVRKAHAEGRSARGALLEVDKPARKRKVKTEPRVVPERFKLLELSEPVEESRISLPRGPLDVSEGKVLPEEPRTPSRRAQLIELDGLPEPPSALPAFALLAWAGVKLYQSRGQQPPQLVLGGALLAFAALLRR